MHDDRLYRKPNFQPEGVFDTPLGPTADPFYRHFNRITSDPEADVPDNADRIHLILTNVDLREMKNRLVAATRASNGALAANLKAAALAVAKVLIDEGVEG